MTAKKKNISQEENIEEVVKIPVEGNQEFENGERIEDSGLAENRIEAKPKPPNILTGGSVPRLSLSIIKIASSATARQTIIR
jgi:hypothetical protein